MEKAVTNLNLNFPNIIGNYYSSQLRWPSYSLLKKFNMVYETDKEPNSKI